MNNIRQWFDGLIYSKMIMPFQMEMYKKLEGYIPEGSTLIDIGCATGAFPMALAPKLKRADGLDLSITNINEARRLNNKKGLKNVDFFHGDASKAASITNRKYDFSFFSYTLHEMPHEIRLSALSEAAKISGAAIIADYAIPFPNFFSKGANYALEFAAGLGHFKNFLDYKERGGLNGLAKQAGLKIKKREIFKLRGIESVLVTFD